ncbi:MAG: MurT ligase domain-containing protein [Patescibacteria group bacterium]
MIGKIVYLLLRSLGFGAGTWPGEVALRINPHILLSFASQFRKGIILVAGTNGKTTTSLMIKTILEAQGLRVVHNASGANLLNGIVSACIQEASWSGELHADYGVFEVDENSLPGVMTNLSSRVRSDGEAISHNHEIAEPVPNCHERLLRYARNDWKGSPRNDNKQKLIIVLLNLFRDQLDRYGEVDVIAEKWQKSLESLESQDRKTRKTNEVKIIASADDPLVAHLGLHAKTTFFGINDKTKFLPKMEHATDSIFCLNCGSRLKYEGIYFSHLGIWSCTKCGEKRPNPDISEGKSPLPGLYNRYNTLAALCVAKVLHVPADLSNFHPAFGRQEEIGNVKIFLSKNPTGFNQSLRTVLELGAKHLLLVLNDRIPDGRDVSWIWDVDFEMIPKNISVAVSGDRVYDLALRLKYAGINAIICQRLDYALETDKILYVLPTYSAMLEVRKILSGNKIL